ncbi:MAG: hypothetical protein ACHBN1_21000 [Heteroscytonema crispum UTEX LB 1556]
MTVINKIYLQVLAQLLRRQNLICSLNWIFQLLLHAAYIGLSPEVRGDLASKHKYQFCSANDYDANWGVSEQIAIGKSHRKKWL